MRICPKKTTIKRLVCEADRANADCFRMLTDNGNEFSDCPFGLRHQAATGSHESGALVPEAGIENCLAPPMCFTEISDSVTPRRQCCRAKLRVQELAATQFQSFQEMAVQ